MEPGQGLLAFGDGHLLAPVPRPIILLKFVGHWMEPCVGLWLPGPPGFRLQTLAWTTLLHGGWAGTWPELTLPPRRVSWALALP